MFKRVATIAIAAIITAAGTATTALTQGQNPQAAGLIGLRTPRQAHLIQQRFGDKALWAFDAQAQEYRALTSFQPNKGHTLFTTMTDAEVTLGAAATSALVSWSHRRRRHGPTAPRTGALTTDSSSGSFWVDPNTDASEAAASLKASGDTADAALIDKIASQPQAIWLTGEDSSYTATVEQDLTAANGAAVVFVLYAIPHRDCGSYASGGYANDSAYESFVNSIVAGVQGRNAWFIIEPDGLDQIHICGLSSTGITDREMLESYAAKQLATVSSHVYLDAGCSDCQPAAYMAPILKLAGIQYATGFSLGVAGFSPIATEQAYGDKLSALVGGKHYVVDTSRNGGSRPPSTWCNPPGQLLGVAPTTATSNPLDDAYLWIKSPGQSDGDCAAGEPVSGHWYQSYAVGLASTGS